MKEEAQRQRPVLHTSTILRMIGCANVRAPHDASLDDFSPFDIGDMRLSLSDNVEDVPHVVPLVNPETFLSYAKEGCLSNSFGELNLRIVPAGVPAYFSKPGGDEMAPRPAFDWGLLFHWAHQEFSRRIDDFICYCVEPVKRGNPDLIWKKRTTPASRPTKSVPLTRYIFPRVCNRTNCRMSDTGFRGIMTVTPNSTRASAMTLES